MTDTAVTGVTNFRLPDRMDLEPHLSARLQHMTVHDERLSLKPRQLNGANGWYVYIEWLDATFEHVGVFHTEAEAIRWIDTKSDTWLKTHVHRMEPAQQIWWRAHQGPASNTR